MVFADDDCDDDGGANATSDSMIYQSSKVLASSATIGPYDLDSFPSEPLPLAISTTDWPGISSTMAVTSSSLVLSSLPGILILVNKLVWMGTSLDPPGTCPSGTLAPTVVALVSSLVSTASTNYTQSINTFISFPYKFSPIQFTYSTVKSGVRPPRGICDRQPPRFFIRIENYQFN